MIRTIKENISFYTLGFIVLAFGIGMAILYSVPVIGTGLVFVLYTIIGMLLPGYALTQLLKIEMKTNVETVAYTIFFGYFISFLEYFLVVPFGIQKMAPVVWIVISILSAVYLFNHIRKKGLNAFAIKDVFGIWTCIFFLAVVVLFRCGIYAGANLYTEKVAGVNMFEDLLYWVGNSIELTKHFPPTDFRHYGAVYNYHYFTSVQIAMTALSTRMSVMLVSFCYSYIYPSAMLVFGGYIVFSKCTEKNYLRLLGLFAFLFTAGFSDFTDNRYAGFMYEFPFAFDYAMGIFMFLTFLVMKEFYKEKLAMKDAGIIVTFFILLCGVKANFGAIALVGIGMCCLRWLSRKEQRKKAIMIGVCTLVPFIIVYIFVTNLKGYSGGAANEFMVSNILTNGSGFGDGRVMAAYEGMKQWPMPKLLMNVVFCILYTVYSNPLVFGIVCIQIIRAIFRREKLADSSLMLMVMIVAGVFIKVYIGMYGWSEQYFMYNIFPVGVMFVLLNWKTEFELKDLESWVKGICLVLLVLISVWGFAKYDQRLSFVEDTVRGYSRYIGSEYKGHFRRSITRSQIEACEWLRDNSGEEDKFICNKSGEQYGCFSERYNINHGEEDNFVGSNDLVNLEKSISVLKNDGIDWAYIIKNPDANVCELNLESNVYDIAFENDEVIIYRFL